MILLTSASVCGQTNIGANVGASFANVSIKAGGFSVSPQLKLGFTAGLFMNVPMSTTFSFQPAINFVQKGYMVTDDSYKGTINLNYIEMPFNFIYSREKNKGFFIGAGPSIAIGISGRQKETDTDFPEYNTNEKVSFGSNDDEVKRTDFGANVITGYKFSNGVILSGNYNLGLSNIANSGGDPGEEGKIKNRYFSVKIGVDLGRNKH